MSFMPTSASLLRLLLLALISPLTAAQSTPSARITGTVVSSADGSPVPRCHLVASLIERGVPPGRLAAPSADGDSDERGHFAMTLPSVGSWLLRASARGYRPQTLDQHDEFSSSVVLTTPEPSIDLLFRLTPDSAITGVVLDEANEAVRGAHVSLYAVLPSRVDGSPSSRVRANATTDDRGRYELAGLGPGDFRLAVEAKPWYAASTQVPRVQPSAPPPLAPSLDVVYPVTWYPGGTDPDTAATITLHGGEVRQADIQLRPIPSVHLHISTTPSTPSPNDSLRRQIRFPQVIPVSPGPSSSDIRMTLGTQGQVDVGGLTPGVYRVQLPEYPSHSALVQISPGSARTLDLANLASTASVEIKIDGAADPGSVAITFVDADNLQSVLSTGATRGGRGLQHRQTVASTQGSLPAPRVIELPPGRYLVYQSTPNLFLTGITFAGKELRGRLVTIPAGDSSITLHIATGRASVAGIATFQGKPAEGAMVMLVPSTVDDPASITELRRDQTNTDGSFEIDGIIPGQYILIALDQGWYVNWNDLSTLRRYLTHGFPVDLKPSENLKQNLAAQLP